MFLRTNDDQAIYFKLDMQLVFNRFKTVYEISRRIIGICIKAIFFEESFNKNKSHISSQLICANFFYKK